MKKQLTFLGFIVVVAILTTFASFGVSKTTGWGYFDALVIGTNPASPTASLTSAGALTVTSITNTGAVGGSAITATGLLTGAGVVSTSYIQYASKTIAQINATTATAVGQGYYCSNCTDDVICVSTGTSRSNEWVGNNGARATCS